MGGAKLTVLYPDPDEHDDATPTEVQEHQSCLHRRVSLDTEARRVYCRNCKREVDPFTVILFWARNWKRITDWRTEAERRRSRAEDRLTEILRLEKNARSRLKKLEPAAEMPPKPWGEGGQIL